MIVYYTDFGRHVDCSLTPYEDLVDRVDTLSYQPVSRSVENFIASGRAVSSLRQITATESDSVRQSLDGAFKHEMTVFDRNIYGPDIAEVSMAEKALDAKAKKVEDDYKLAQKVKDARANASERSGEPSAAEGSSSSDGNAPSGNSI